jgi:cytochrome c-type biogenesis protein CcmH
LAGSNAPIAKDLKLEIYKLIKKNKSDQEITNFLTQRYGDFILYKPPFNSLTYILWVGPFILLCFILLFVGWFVASKKPSTSEKFLDSE